MTDSEKLDLILEKISILDQKVTGLEKDMVDVKADLRQLHRDDDFIINQVERVHAILDKHKENKSVHTA